MVANDGNMVYDKAKMTTLIQELRQYHSDLVSLAGDGSNDSGSELGQAYQKLKQAWTDPNSGVENGALTDVAAAKTKWDTAYQDKCLQTLDAVATAVETALNDALAADSKVGGSFA
ncbi:hypothetical protein [Nocardia sp. NBC_00511]|uniref:hypothetical protein n=1 Tax=Nocardia sp. NBC_00511 TaxID=2903591 RepID=UPI0030E3C981